MNLILLIEFGQQLYPFLLHHQQLLPITDNSVRLEGTPQELAAILRKSKVCYVYEPSNIIFDALLCGCRVVLVRTHYFNDLPTQGDWGFSGVRWNDAMDTPLNPKESIFWWRDVKEEYIAALEQTGIQLQRFIGDTQFGGNTQLSDTQC